MNYRFRHFKKVKIHYTALAYGKTQFEGNNVVNEKTKVISCNIGKGTYIGSYNIFYNMKVGRFCSIGSNITVLNAGHPTRDYVSTHPAFYSTVRQAGFTFVNKNNFKEKKYCDNGYSVVIGNDVFIGSNVIILAGVTINDGAIIGAGSLITKDVAPYSIVGGVPAKEIRKRFNDNEIKFLSKYHWWDKDFEWLKNNAIDFNNIKLFMSKHKGE